MRAVGYTHSLPIDQAESLIDIEIAKPAPLGRDLLVQVKAISVNPVDTKVRMRADPKGGEPKILGYDATGIVAAVGPDVTLFKAGDEVWYAGSIIRPGTNSEFHLVDERIVGAKPKSLDFALPPPGRSPRSPRGKCCSTASPSGARQPAIAVDRRWRRRSRLDLYSAARAQLLTAIATASRPETQAWCWFGAHHVIDHKADGEQPKRSGIASSTIFSASPNPTSTSTPSPTSWRRRASSA